MRKKKLIRNLIIILLGVIWLLPPSYGTPEKALNRYERDIHYGPSIVLETVESKNEIVYLTKYQGWYGIAFLHKNLLGRYRIMGDYCGMEQSNQEKVTLYWGWTKGIYTICGVIHDSSITSMDLVFKAGHEYSIAEQYTGEKMFFMTGKIDKMTYFKLTGKDQNGDIVWIGGYGEDEI